MRFSAILTITAVSLTLNAASAHASVACEELKAQASSALAQRGHLKEIAANTPLAREIAKEDKIPLDQQFAEDELTAVYKQLATFKLLANQLNCPEVKEGLKDIS